MTPAADWSQAKAKARLFKALGHPTRLFLVEMMDKLLDVLERESRYRAFLLDSQTAPLDDYLEIRPGGRARIEAQVRAGRLFIGPWYTCPEEFNVSGESLVRNLVFGHRVAQSFGGVTKVGYSPFSYGQCSQMPQIYNGFGIDTIIFYRGINTPHSEFVLEGPDGSRLRVVMDTWASGLFGYTQGARALAQPQAIVNDWLPYYRLLGRNHGPASILASGTHGDISPTSGGAASSPIPAAITRRRWRWPATSCWPGCSARRCWAPLPWSSLPSACSTRSASWA
jgi:hypothetical protein